MQFEVEAILFDVDGTLVDSTAAVERTWRTWAAAYGLDAEAILAVCHGRRSADTVAEFLPAKEHARALAELERIDLADVGGITALPGTTELLPRLPAHRWAAVTSGSRELMGSRLEVAGLPQPRALVSAEDVAVGKPDPEGYLKAARLLGFAVERCLVVEDAPAGLRAGRASGALVLAVATSHPADELTGEADAVVADLTRCCVEVMQTGLVVRV